MKHSTITYKQYVSGVNKATRMRGAKKRCAAVGKLNQRYFATMRHGNEKVGQA